MKPEDIFHEICDLEVTGEGTAASYKPRLNLRKLCTFLAALTHND